MTPYPTPPRPASESDSIGATVSALPLTPPVVPDHNLISRIGSGSYGEVWLARTAVGTLRAVKIVHRQSFERVEHFEREFKGLQKFEPISRSHEGLVDILQIGRDDAAGCFYYVMELADPAGEAGEKVGKRESGLPTPVKAKPPPIDPATYTPKTLRSLLSPATCPGLPVVECIDIGFALASALEHLHAHGLVHRDIKPSNIIFVDGILKLADIGLVTHIDDARSLVGTAGYIPPEGPGAAQADIYSLGKVLYEISLGKDRQDFPQLPPDLQSHPDHAALLELNEVTLKACESDPRRRYQTAQQMRDDLGLLQSGQSIKRARTHQRRRTLFVKLAAALALAAVVAVGGTAIVRQLAESSINPSDRLSRNPLANKAYLEGVHCSRRDTEEGFSQGIAHFKRAIEIDPGFAMAYNGLYEIYVANPGPSSRACVDKMMELEPRLAEAHAGQGYLDFLDWKWSQAEPHFRRAIELNPRCAIAHMRYGFCLVSAGRTEEGHRELLAAESLNPTSPRIKKNLGHVFYVRRQFREAMAQYQKAIDLEPNYPTSHRFIGNCHRALGNYTNAMDAMERYDLVTKKDPAAVRQRYVELRQAYAKEGPRGYWLKQLEQADPAEPWGMYWKAQAYAHLEDYDRALDSLGKQFEQPAVESLNLLIRDECWDPVHEDPRFVALLKKTGLRK